MLFIRNDVFYTGIAITIIAMMKINKNMPITKARKKQPSDDFFESFGSRKANGISHGHLFINQKPKIISQSVFIFQLLSAKGLLLHYSCNITLQVDIYRPLCLKRLKNIEKKCPDLFKPGIFLFYSVILTGQSL